MLARQGTFLRKKEFFLKKIEINETTYITVKTCLHNSNSN